MGKNFKFKFKKEGENLIIRTNLKSIKKRKNKEIKVRSKCIKNWNIKEKKVKLKFSELKFKNNENMLKFCKNDIKNHEKYKKIYKIANKIDIKPGLYEGGLKLWECSVDIIRFIDKTKMCFDGRNILEIGCGHGLPGVYCAMNGADKVIFQDLNKEVLKLVTSNNIMENVNIEQLDNIGLVSGDWRDKKLIKCIKDLEPKKFNIILASDILYNSNLYPYILKIFKKLLNKKGFILLASKRYYFGNRGSLFHFKQMAIEKGFKWNIANTIIDGKSNLREIIKICYK